MLIKFSAFCLMTISLPTIYTHGRDKRNFVLRLCEDFFLLQTNRDRWPGWGETYMQKVPGRYDRILIIFISLFLTVVIWGSYIFRVEKMLHEEKRNLATEATTVLDASVQHTLMLLNQIGVFLRSVRQFYNHCHSIEETERFIESIQLDRSLTPNFFLADAAGKLLIPSDESTRGVNVTDRGYFRYHQQNAGDGLFISAVEIGRVTGKFHFRVALRIDKPDGSFDGVVLVTVSPELFTRYFKDLQLGSQFVASLLGIHDRKMRARVPEPANDMWATSLQNPEWEKIIFDASASFQTRSPVDHIYRNFVYKRVGDFPLGMLVGFSDADVINRVEEAKKWLQLIAIMLTIFIAVVTIAMLEKVKASQLLLQRNQLMLADLAAAAKIQSALLPRMDFLDRRVDMHLRFLPCNQVGGDMVNVIPFSENLIGVYCLDVSGHGIPAALTGVALSHMLRSDGKIVSQMHDGVVVPNSPGEIIARLEREFPFEDLGQYLTMVFLLMDRAKNQLQIAAAGHPAPLLVLPDGQVEEIKVGGLPVGFGDGEVREEIMVEIPAGAALILYSDGITEQPDPKGKRFGLSRLKKTLGAHAHEGITGMVDAAWNELASFRGKAFQDDDMSLLGVNFSVEKNTKIES